VNDLTGAKVVNHGKSGFFASRSSCPTAMDLEASMACAVVTVAVASFAAFTAELIFPDNTRHLGNADS